MNNKEIAEKSLKKYNNKRKIKEKLNYKELMEEYNEETKDSYRNKWHAQRN